MFYFTWLPEFRILYICRTGCGGNSLLFIIIITTLYLYFKLFLCSNVWRIKYFASWLNTLNEWKNHYFLDLGILYKATDLYVLYTIL
ncbi:hypothetical protein VNO78_17611 [Psophocarpus tetragonolobus]|uniref:Uncharacterized protein n=1 Tax=Psophocarpus tetragonolobus TaxID=3891 RepID=A0AAN9SMX8_PSOTE